MRWESLCFLDGDLSDSLRQIQRTDSVLIWEALKTLLSSIRRLRPRYEAAADITIDIREKNI